MNSNRNSTWFTAVGIVSIIAGVLYCITLIGIIVGIPLFIGAAKYLNYAKMSDEAVLAEKSTVMVWAIVFAVVMFPLGLIALVPALNLEGNVDRATSGAVTGVKSAFEKKDPMEEKMEKIQKLYEMKEKGIIDEEDFAAAKAKILRD